MGGVAANLCDSVSVPTTTVHSVSVREEKGELDDEIRAKKVTRDKVRGKETRRMNLQFNTGLKFPCVSRALRRYTCLQNWSRVESLILATYWIIPIV